MNDNIEKLKTIIEYKGMCTISNMGPNCRGCPLSTKVFISGFNAPCRFTRENKVLKAQDKLFELLLEEKLSE